MVEGDNHFVALSWSPLPPPRTLDEADARLRRTSEYWRQWITLGDFPDHPWRSYLQRSALTLKGLTYAPTGALLAAATTSLPETPRGERNWDYRYAWVRDSTFALWGLYTLGFDREADDFFYFVADVCRDGNDLQVMYGVGGERELDESRCRTCPATRAPSRCGSATAPSTSASTTSGAPCSTRSTCTPGRASSCPSRCGRCSSGRSSRPPSTGRSPTAASGRCAASRSTSPRAS